MRKCEKNEEKCSNDHEIHIFSTTFYDFRFFFRSYNNIFWNPKSFFSFLSLGIEKWMMSSLTLPLRPCFRRLGAHGQQNRVGLNGNKKEANFFPTVYIKDCGLHNQNFDLIILFACYKKKLSTIFKTLGAGVNTNPLEPWVLN